MGFPAISATTFPFLPYAGYGKTVSRGGQGRHHPGRLLPDHKPGLMRLSHGNPDQGNDGDGQANKIEIVKSAQHCITSSFWIIVHFTSRMVQSNSCAVFISFFNMLK
jgi:hypothetical protein